MMRTWAMPLMLAATTLTGLVTALTGAGLGDHAAAVMLALPVAAIVWARAARRI